MHGAHKDLLATRSMPVARGQAEDTLTVERCGACSRWQRVAAAASGALALLVLLGVAVLALVCVCRTGGEDDDDDPNAPPSLWRRRSTVPRLRRLNTEYDDGSRENVFRQ